MVNQSKIEVHLVNSGLEEEPSAVRSVDKALATVISFARRPPLARGRLPNAPASTGRRPTVS